MQGHSIYIVVMGIGQIFCNDGC